MRFKEGDKVEFIYKNKKSVGEINGVYHGTQEVSIKQSDSPVDLLFSDKAVVKVEEQERIVVPQFVADWISQCKQEGYDLSWSINYDDSDMPYEIFEWLNPTADNQELFARAWMDGYEVEKEQLYYVKLIDQATGYLNVRSDGCKSLNNSVQNDIFKTQFTEADIKAIDERYWQFAVPVEEVTE
ncbi:DUF1642 domain-containing protein [Listeria monocytogenes]|uniref:DUF1642 domain-containing protein n=1 Tax=Listeria monocytogenes TaxID=1639 RepID=A0A9P1WUT4_LISMN|nr:DUF1642 domain-containing protein [Listeria monocytogenes]EAC2304478.1 DUF1642 domain-containing protein [Listeria monocytogenes]EAC5550814.1 DUF1642 domain-containing protein [Listeria monocytogenes]EAC7931515.1 DUF1642 domain-containing protein [Listeria monocytogenes]EAC9283865.1 DUF1642 domain-containing protein [Listeria monocytogenes]